MKLEDLPLLYEIGHTGGSERDFLEAAWRAFADIMKRDNVVLKPFVYRHAVRPDNGETYFHATAEAVPEAA